MEGSFFASPGGGGFFSGPCFSMKNTLQFLAAQFYLVQGLRTKRNALREGLHSVIGVLVAVNSHTAWRSPPSTETDLHAVIRANILEEIHKKYIIYQLVKALKFMHSADLLHRDIKPSNLLLNSDCHVKLCDFGLCRNIAETTGPQPHLTDYVATRWYRAPEILLGSPRYTKGVDMWAVGCILGEMLRGRPTFPGTSTMNQVRDVLSAPSPGRQISRHGSRSSPGTGIISRGYLVYHRKQNQTNGLSSWPDSTKFVCFSEWRCSFAFDNLLLQHWTVKLEKIMECTGKPSPEDIQSIKSPFAGTMLESIPPTRQISLNEVFSGASAQALDLMSQCLHFNPDKRVRAADALKHPYVAEFHNPDDEPDYPHGAIQVGEVRDRRKLLCLCWKSSAYHAVG